MVKIIHHNGTKVDINYNKTGKFSNMCRLNYMLLNSQWVNEEIKKHVQINENRNTTYQHLWGAAKES